ncbi:dihydroanticapsin 7-dehydrogenase-like [Lineus longissimus]|uniref:dihydroanticapsin 7-dehydrogenase-like n=1 Tax=Lineus longissimus TaxID=88925 RepID=UPI00315C69EF
MAADNGFPFPRMGPILAGTRERFTDRVAIVTGGASGIGRATVTRLANDGAMVAIFDINDDLGKALATELSEKGDAERVTQYNVDISKMDAVEAGVRQVVEKYGGIHLLVNNAVDFCSAGATNVTHEDWVRSWGVNVEGAANMVKVCQQYMQKDDRCAIVNMGSGGGHRALPMRMTYCATKAAIAQMTRNMALDLIEKKVRVNCVEPAATYTPEIAKAFGSREKATDYYSNCHLTRRLADPDEIASAICFLLSEEASFITASCLPIDGGYSAMNGERFGDPTTIAATKK